MWIDDERATPSFAYKNIAFDITARTTNEALRLIKRKYQAGERNFFLDIDNDTEDSDIDVINVIYEGDDYVISTNTSNDEYLNLYDKVLLEPLETVENQTSEEPKEIN